MSKEAHMHIMLFGGNSTKTTDAQVNEWLQDDNHQKWYEVIDIKYSYSNGYHGVMIIYKDKEA